MNYWRAICFISRFALRGGHSEGQSLVPFWKEVSDQFVSVSISNKYACLAISSQTSNFTCPQQPSDHHWFCP